MPGDDGVTIEASGHELVISHPEKVFFDERGDTKLDLYIYYPEGHKPTDKRPAIVFFFGGGWTNGSPGQFEQHCKHLASRGMVAITAAASTQRIRPQYSGGLRQTPLLPCAPR